MNNAVSRRDQVDKFKSIFLIVKLALMGVVSVLSTGYLVYMLYAAEVLKKNKIPDVTYFLETWLPKTENLLLSISYGICALLATCFITFLILHGIQTLVVRFMMRNSG